MPEVVPRRKMVKPNRGCAQASSDDPTTPTRKQAGLGALKGRWAFANVRCCWQIRKCGAQVMVEYTTVKAKVHPLWSS